MTLLAIDPGRSFKGEASIGVCLWSRQWEWRELNRFETTFEELVDALDYDSSGLTGWGRALHEVVIEDYVNNAQSKGGQHNGTSECIGAVEALCRKSKTPFTRQEPAALGPAKLHAPAGSWKPLKHLRHEDSAYLHGYEFLVRRGELQSAGLRGTL